MSLFAGLAGARRAASAPAPPGGQNLLPPVSRIKAAVGDEVWAIQPQGQWLFCLFGTAQGSMARDGDAVKFTVTQVDGTDWHCTIKYGLNLVNGDTYELRYQARADSALSMGVASEYNRSATPPTPSAAQTSDDYHLSGLQYSVSLTPQWQTFVKRFVVTGAEDGHNIMPEFFFGHQPGTIWLKDISLVRNPPPEGSPAPPGSPATGPRPRAGEIMLTGTVMSVSTAAKSLLLAVTAVTLPDGTTTALPAPRPKTVLTGPQTLILTPDLTQRALADLKDGAALSIIGKDGGTGKALKARTVIESPSPTVSFAPPGRAVLPNGSFDYRFDGRISRGVLENYLARAITEADLLRGRGSTDDNVRMLLNINAKFVGRSIGLWGGEAALPGRLTTARPIAQRLHAADADVILEAAEFEIVTRQVEQLPVPDWVFREFGLPVEARHFRYEDMLYLDGHGKAQWGREMSVPDMSRLETRLWFFYLAASYIDVGCEAIHFGQVGIMDQKDAAHASWFDELMHVRRYAAAHARRHFVLCNAHEPSGGVTEGGRLLFDFHEFPLRIKEVPDQPLAGALAVGYSDSFYGRSKGGITPSGWNCVHLPYLVEYDNYGVTAHRGENWHGDGNPCWVWGYDEIGWFAHQSESYRSQWLGYAWEWVRGHDPNGYVEMPGSRTLEAPVNGNVRWYWANTASAAVPTGFGQEEAIKAIWARDTPS